jgi:poly-gamma-glutamate synthesis protein (capsule biosynthesis protein)
MSEMLTLFVCGDVMTGRGVDQALPHSVDPALREPYVKDARQYIELAEQANGPFERPMEPAAIWGAALEELAAMQPAARIANLETAVTTSPEFWPGKGIHYRMHPANVDCLTAAGLDAVALANNHVLDLGYPGLRETLHALREAGLRTLGAGQNRDEAGQSIALDGAGATRIRLLAAASPSSGVPMTWAATEDRPGVCYLDEHAPGAIDETIDWIRAQRNDDEVVVLSIHWGGNWGFEVDEAHRRLAHRLIDDAGVDLIFGHSSHHPRPVEVHHGRLILYGCGDFLNDYEGIGGHEMYHPDLAAAWFPRLDPSTGEGVELIVTPFIRRQFRIHAAGEDDARWLAEVLTRYGDNSVAVSVDGENRLRVRPAT